MITQPPAQAQSDAERAYLGKPQELIQRARQEAKPRGIVGGQGNQPMLPEGTGILAAANDFLEIMAANNREQSKGIPETPDLSTKILNSFEQFFTQNKPPSQQGMMQNMMGQQGIMAAQQRPPMPRRMPQSMPQGMPKRPPMPPQGIMAAQRPPMPQRPPQPPTMVRAGGIIGFENGGLNLGGLTNVEEVISILKGQGISDDKIANLSREDLLSFITDPKLRSFMGAKFPNVNLPQAESPTGGLATIGSDDTATTTPNSFMFDKRKEVPVERLLKSLFEGKSNQLGQMKRGRGTRGTEEETSTGILPKGGFTEVRSGDDATTTIPTGGIKKEDITESPIASMKDLVRKDVAEAEKRLGKQDTQEQVDLEGILKTIATYGESPVATAAAKKARDEALEFQDPEGKKEEEQRKYLGDIKGLGRRLSTEQRDIARQIKDRDDLFEANINDPLQRMLDFTDAVSVAGYGQTAGAGGRGIATARAARIAQAKQNQIDQLTRLEKIGEGESSRANEVFDNLLSIHAADTSRRNNALNIAEDRRSNVTTAIRASAQNLLELANDDRDHAFKLSEYAFNKNIQILDLKIKKLNSDLEALDNVRDAFEALKAAKNEAVQEILNDPTREDVRKVQQELADARDGGSDAEIERAETRRNKVILGIQNEVDIALQYKGSYEILLRKLTEAERQAKGSKSEVGSGIMSLGGPPSKTLEDKLKDSRLGN